MSLTLPAPRTSLAAVLVGALAVSAGSQLVASCTDNVGCIYEGDCSGDRQSNSGGIGGSGNPATLPLSGQWISNAVPMVTDVFPQGRSINPTTPIVLVFSESMNADSLEDAFDVITVGSVFSFPVTIDRQILIGEGRVLVLFPSGNLSPGTYAVRLAGAGGPFGGGGSEDGPELRDLTGQLVQLDPGEQVGESFTVPVDAPASPQLIATWPLDGETAASETTEVVCVFDRALAASTLDDASFQVVVDGSPPAVDPSATFLASGGSTERRVVTWQSASGGVPSLLPLDATVDVDLSKTGGTRLADSMGNEVAAETFTFDITPFGAPRAARLEANGETRGSIGVRNLTPGDALELSMVVDVAAGQQGDFVEAFFFGDSKGTPSQLIALRRDVVLEGAGTVTEALFSLAELNLTLANDPSDARFRDGAVAIAVRNRRGNVVSPLTVLDVDATASGIQDPLLDTRPPTIASFVHGDRTTAMTVSDVRDLVVAGAADEALARLTVEVFDGGGNPLGDNSAGDRVLGSRAGSAFLAAPVVFESGGQNGVLPPGPITFVATAYDEVDNASDPVTGTFRQLGAVRPAASFGDPVVVEVFDATTLDPVENARVVVHDASGNFVETGFTDVDGLFTSIGATLTSIVTVDEAGFDLFTFDGIPSEFVSVPLTPTGAAAGASISGAVTSDDDLVETFLPSFDRALSDARRPLISGARTFGTDTCIDQPVSCDFGPEPIRPGVVGALGFFAGNFSRPAEASFLTSAILRAFCLELPFGPVARGAVEDGSIALPFLLDDPALDPTVRALEAPDEVPEDPDGLLLADKLMLRADTTAGLENETAGGVLSPVITLEGLVPGTPGAVAVGLGFAYDRGTDVWNLRTVRPGAVRADGCFGEVGAIDTDLFIRCEVVDADGNVAVARPRLSELPVPPGIGVLTVADVPVLTSPAEGATGVASAVDLVFADTIPDAVGLDRGIYRAELTDASGRRWVAWRLDPAGGGNVTVRLPDIEMAGATALADGAIEVVVSAFAWAAFDPVRFLWTDIEREYDHYARSRAYGYTQGAR